jgi:hypothetical protein
MAAMTSRNRFLSLAATLVALVVLASPATAGPPLICQPFITDGEALLPWGEGRGWHSPDFRYDTARLTDDTLTLLTPDAPVLARMENLRRATIYAAADSAAAAELLAAVLKRTETSQGSLAAQSLAWFDAGYLIESYRQFGPAAVDMLGARAPGVPPPHELVAELDGYGLVLKAIEVGSRAARADMEFAASLMVRDSTVAEAHRARAEAGAKHGSLLAANLAR